MQAFELNWLRWLVVMIVTGIALAGFLYLGFYVSARPLRRPVEEEREEFPAGLEVAQGGIPPILIAFYIVMLIYLVAYTLYVWLAPVSY